MLGLTVIGSAAGLWWWAAKRAGTIVVATEPARLFRCATNATYLPSRAPDHYPVELTSDVRVLAHQIDVTYEVRNAASEPYKLYVRLGGAGGSAAHVQVDVTSGVVLLKKQRPASCEADSESDVPPVLLAETIDLAPEQVFVERFSIDLPLRANYEPRASELLAQALRDGTYRLGDSVELLPLHRVSVRQIGIGIGVAPARAPDEQVVVYDFHELDEEIRALEYELVPQ